MWTQNVIVDTKVMCKVHLCGHKTYLNHICGHKKRPKIAIFGKNRSEYRIIYFYYPEGVII